MWFGGCEAKEVGARYLMNHTPPHEPHFMTGDNERLLHPQRMEYGSTTAVGRFNQKTGLRAV
jgi:hypothetical protein